MGEEIDLFPYPSADGREYDSYVLLKFMGELDFAMSFLDGKLYFNTAEFFSKCDEIGRGDETEGTKFTVPPISKDFKSANLEFVNGKSMIVCRDYSSCPEDYKKSTIFAYKPVERKYRKLISFYSLYLNLKDNYRDSISDDMKKDFGKYGVLIINRKEFYKRVAAVLNNRKDAMMGFVQYMSKEEEEGYVEYTPFKKRYMYSHQNEMRITYIGEDDKPEIIDVGDLHDIAFLISADYLDDIYVKNHTFYYPICEVKEI